MKFFALVISGLAFVFSSHRSCDNMPALNQEILAFVKSRINKKVGRGECWDLAAEALHVTGAKWDHDLGFGKEVNPLKDCIYPGDIIQFEGVKMEYREKNNIFFQDLEHHTAIIYEVMNTGQYTLAEQNTNQHGRKVSIGKIDLKNITKGKYKLYRPVK